MNRRSFLVKLASTLGVSAGTAALLAACGSEPAPGPSAGPPAATSVSTGTVSKASSAASDTPKRGGSFKIPVIANITPWPPIGRIQNLMVNKALFNGLVRYSAADWTPEPDLAEKWEVSKDGLTWTFSLRKGVTWHDGKPFTADDVKWTLEMYRDPKVGSILRSNLEPVTGIEVVDPNTVKLMTKEPYSSLVELLAYLTFMLPKHLLEKEEFTAAKAPESFVRKPVGTGAFKFGENKEGDHYTVVANENYWEGKPYLDSVIFKVVRDLNSTVAQVKTGELDIAFPTAAQMPALQGASNLNIVERGLMDYRFFVINYKSPEFGKWYGDKRVRQALAQAINVPGIMQQVAQGKATRSNGPVPPALKSWYVKDAPVFDYDPEKAKKMLAEFGLKAGPDGILAKDGQKFSFTFNVDQGQPEREQTSLLVQQNLKDIGIEAKLQPLEFVRFNESMVVKRDYTALCFYYVTPSTPDLHTYWQTGASINNWGYSNPEVDKLFDEGLKTFDDSRRHEIYKKLYTIMADDQAVNFLYHPLEIQAINKKVRGWAETNYRDALLYLSKVWIE